MGYPLIAIGSVALAVLLVRLALDVRQVLRDRGVVSSLPEAPDDSDRAGA